MVSLTARIAGTVLSWAPGDEGAAAELAERAAVDTVAGALAAREDPTVLLHLKALGAPTSTEARALLGGLAGHALDYDDVDDLLIGHPSTVLVPALLALAAERDLSGSRVVDAFSVGLFVCRQLATVTGIDAHYSAGWHATSTIGTVAGATALARLLELDEERTRCALGIAGSLALGSRQNFGTMTKPLHAGVAASNAVLAAKLAEAGFTADPDQLDGPLGFLALHHGADGTPDARVPGPDEMGLNVKLYPCCYYLHAALDTVLDLHQDVDPDRVEKVEVTVHPGGLRPLIHHRPQTGLQGKFSMEYAVAAGLLDGRIRLATFTDEAVRRPAAQALLRKVVVANAEDPPVGGPRDGAYAVVRITTQDGQVHEGRTDRARGHASRPVDDAELRAKWDDCVSFGRWDEGAAFEELYTRLRGLREEASVRSLVDLLVSSVGGAR